MTLASRSRRSPAGSRAAWSIAVRLVGLAQRPRASRALAERALRSAEALAAALEAEGARFQLDPGPLDTAELDEPDEAERAPAIRGTAEEGGPPGLLWPLRGRCAKGRWEGETAARGAALRRWVLGTLLAPLALHRLSLARLISASSSRSPRCSSR